MDQVVNWENKNSYVLANPRLPEVRLPSAWEGFHNLDSHIWVATSGTTATIQQIKWIALSKAALLHSAAAVNQHLKSSSADIWLNPLPLFHVGGLSIYARAYLSGAEVLDISAWQVESFHKLLIQKKVNLTSLVPTQLYDLMQRKLSPPPSLRGVLVGGGHLQSSLYSQATSLGWPILPTFGMTECSSQIATALPHDPELKILPHVQCKTVEGVLHIKSKSLLTGQLTIRNSTFNWNDPKNEEWYPTEDRVEINQGTLKILGRLHDWIKISGENVSLPSLEALFVQLKGDLEAEILAVPDDRVGHRLEVATLENHQDQLKAIVMQFNTLVMPYERILHIRSVDEIPRNSLGKVLKQQLLKFIQKDKPCSG